MKLLLPERSRRGKQNTGILRFAQHDDSFAGNDDTFVIALDETSSDEGDRLDAGDVETFAAANILATDHIVAAHHVALSLGKARAIALVGSAGELTLFSSNNPAEFVFCLLAAVRAGHGVGPLLRTLIEKVPFFHPAPLDCVQFF
jgi:hypothetical protein